MMEWFWSRKKGEVVLRSTLGNLLALTSGTPRPVQRTFHFGVKCGHIVLFRGEQWLLSDPGYINFFRPDTPADAKLNTLRTQKLLGRGWMWVKVRDGEVRIVTCSVFPLHLRKVFADESLNSVRVRDYYLGRRTIDWRGPGLESKTAWFTQELVL